MKRNIDGTLKCYPKDAIKSYFQSAEIGIERRCEKCPAENCSKKLTLESPPNFIVVQFKRFTKRDLRNRVSLEKINAESETFTHVDINTLQGLHKYEVMATIEHKGNKLVNGHYISYILMNGKKEMWLLQRIYM